jgi:hypothetical protein
MEQIKWQMMLGMVVPWVLQLLKKLPWFPLLTEHSERWVKIAWSAIIAAGSAFALSFAYDPTLGRMTIDGLTWANMGNGLLAFLTSMFAQEGSYSLFVKNWWGKSKKEG